MARASASRKDRPVWDPPVRRSLPSSRGRTAYNAGAEGGRGLPTPIINTSNEPLDEIRTERLRLAFRGDIIRAGDPSTTRRARSGTRALLDDPA